MKQIPSLRKHDQGERCVCGENECNVSPLGRGEVILFLDIDEAEGLTGRRCDCIIALKRADNSREVFSVELKSVRGQQVREALDPGKLIEKCVNCIRWLDSAKILARIDRRYCVLVVPENVVSLLNREKRRLISRARGNGIVDYRVIACGGSLTPET